MDAPQEADFGLFFTSLVKTQTNVDGRGKGQRREKESKADREWGRGASHEAFRRPPIKPVEERFRHSGWQVERLRIRTALLAANVPQSRYERFCDCGSDCLVEWSNERQQHRCRANYCGDRFCLPCSRARSRKVRKWLADRLGDTIPLLITLTIRNVEGPLQDRINHLLHSFRRLRQQKGWKDHIKAGAAFVEIKKGKGSGHWHPHLHIIAVGRFFPAKELSDAWRQATTDSYRVQIERARDAADGLGYGAKYASKGWAPEVSRDLDSCIECILALRGRRLCIPFGDWHGARPEEYDSGPDDWVRVGTLDYCFNRWLAGDEWASGVFRSLMNGHEEALLEPPDGTGTMPAG